MVSADNLHLDVLQLIFEHITEHDIAAVSLVSRSFFNGSIPRLYKKITFTDGHAKRYMKTVSPFAALLKRPYAAVYVQICHINAIPLYKGRPHHQFLYDSIKALDLCLNLSDFRLCTNILPTYIATLLPKERMRTMSFNGSLTEAQVQTFTQLSPAIRSLHVEHGSWCLMNHFPRWMAKLSPTLRHLSINLTSEVNAEILEQSLKELPNLRGLHITSCMKVDHHDVLRLVRYTPLLESLSITTWEHPSITTEGYAELHNLQHLVLDTRNAISGLTLLPLWGGIIASTERSNAPLLSLTLQLSDKANLGPDFIQQLLHAHAHSLTELRFKNCSIALDLLAQICQCCHELRVLQVPVDLKKLPSLVEALQNSQSLQVLIDDRVKHSTDSIAPSLTLENAKHLMTKLPSLRTIESETKRWTATRDSDSLQITLERMRPGSRRSEHQLHRFS